MPMKMELHQENRGSSVKIKFIIAHSGIINNENTHKININDLASVQFFLSKAENSELCIDCQMLVEKKTVDCAIKMKVISKQLNYSLERIYSETEFRNSIGNKFYDVQVEHNFYLYKFTIFISASKYEDITEKLHYPDVPDFQLRTAEGSVAVHKACLAAHSDVFKTMLTREWNSKAEGCLQMKGVTLQNLQHLKQYMYLGTLPDDGLLPLLSIASCYSIRNLKTECISKLTNNIKPEDFHNLLEYSFQNNNQELTYSIIMSTPKSVVAEAKKIELGKDIN